MMSLLDESSADKIGGAYERVDNIHEGALVDYRLSYGQMVTTDDIFYLVYGLLHSPDYRSE